MSSDDDERQMCATYGQPCPYAGAQCESGCVRLAARRPTETKREDPKEPADEGAR